MKENKVLFEVYHVRRKIKDSNEIGRRTNNLLTVNKANK